MVPRVTYRIASFNIKQFSDESAFHGNGKDSKKDLDTIARIVKDNNIDIIAIQEIRGKLAFKELISAIAYGYAKDITASILEQPWGDGKSMLSSQTVGMDYLACEAGNWAGRWTHPNSKWGTAIAEEGYAFIWNKNRVDLPVNKRGRVQPVIKHKKEIYFVRPPFYGRFITKDIGVNFEIRLLNTHVLYTKNAKLKSLKDSGIDVELLNSENQAERMRVKRELLEVLTPLEVDIIEKFSNQNDIERRRSEVRNLITEVMEREETDNGYGCYLLMLGDYNLNIFNPNTPYKNRRATIEDTIIYAPDSKNGEMKTYKIIQNELTTLKTPPQVEKDPDGLYDKQNGIIRFSNNYDHFTYNENMNRNGDGGRGIYLSKPQTINALDKYGISNRDYFERISDHLPIMIEIGF